MKSILVLLALAFLVFQIQAKPEPESEQEPLDISDENDSQEEEPPLGFLTENETIEPEENALDDSQEEDAIIQSLNANICYARGARCSSRCFPNEKRIGYCRTNVSCCLRDGKEITLSTPTCNNRKGICQRRNRACRSGSVFKENLNDCSYKHVNKCCKR